MKIAIAGTGYVGLSNAILLSQHHKVTAVDVIQEKVDMVNRKESPIVDDYIEDYLAHKDLDLTATMDGDSAYRDADLIVIAAPTNYDTETNHFDTSAVEAILSQIQRVGSKAIVVIKSTMTQDRTTPGTSAVEPWIQRSAPRPSSSSNPPSRSEGKFPPFAIAGTGYVGLSNAILLSQHHKVTAVDVIQEKVDMVNRKESPIVDDYIEDYLAHKDLDLTATMDGDSAYREADLIVIAAPTNYDTETNHFDTSAVEAILSQIQRVGSKAIVVIKSTIPIGYTQEISAVYPDLSILFAPEFLREGKALYDNLYPSRIIVGIPKGKEALRPEAEKFAALEQEGAVRENIPVLITGSSEAESIKLFSNTFLAIRVAYFNEIDTYAEEKGLKTADIIKGMGYDPRIGDFYNNGTRTFPFSSTNRLTRETPSWASPSPKTFSSSRMNATSSSPTAKKKTSKTSRIKSTPETSLPETKEPYSKSKKNYCEMKNHFAIVLFIVQSLFLRFFLFQPVIFLLQGRKGFIADIMLDLACIVEGVLFGNAHGFQNVGKDLMPFIDPLGDRLSCLRQMDAVGFIHRNQAFLAKFLHGNADRGLGIPHFIGHVDGSHCSKALLQYKDRLHIHFRCFMYFHEITCFRQESFYHPCCILPYSVSIITFRPLYSKPMGMGLGHGKSRKMRVP